MKPEAPTNYKQAIEVRKFDINTHIQSEEVE